MHRTADTTRSEVGCTRGGQPHELVQSSSENDKIGRVDFGYPNWPAWISFDIRYYTVALVYVVFAVAVIVRYLWGIVGILRGEAPEEIDITKANSGL